MTSLARDLIAQLVAAGNADDAVAKAQYLQAHDGGYGAGDEFVGVRVPQVRAIAKTVKGRITLDDVDALLDSSIHEARLLAAIAMVEMYKPKRAPIELRDKIVELLLRRVERFNNWDLIDTVAPHTLGVWLLEQPQQRQNEIVDELAASEVLWRRRLAMISTQGMMRGGDLRQVIRLAHKLIDDREDLMHKAVGWMLREAGQYDRAVLYAFLDEHAATMPRTALRYALEKHSPDVRAHYMGLAARL